MVVILDEDEDTKSATSPRPSQSNSRNRQLEDIEAAPPYDSEQTPLRYPYDVPPSRPLFKRGEPAGPRFWKAFFVAWAVWFLVAFSVILEIEISIDLNKDRWAKKPKNPSSPNGPSHPDIEQPEEPTAGNPGDKPEIDAPGCIFLPGAPGSTVITPGEPAYKTNVNFTLPVESDELYFFNNGSLSWGYVDIVVTEQENPNIFVDITAHYDSPRAIENIEICSLARSNGARGIGIITPEQIDDVIWNEVRFDVIVNLPKPLKGESPLVLKNFTANFTTFFLLLGDLSKDVMFGNLDLKTTSVTINSQSVRGDRISLQTENAKIIGNFMASSIELITANQPIEANVTLIDTPEAGKGELVVRTSNAPIHASISLESTRTDPAESKFSVNARSSNSGLIFGVSPQPFLSQLDFKGETSNAPALLSLPPSYEGKFLIQSTISRPVLEARDVADPTGRGKLRVVDIQKVHGSSIEGEIWWKSKNDDETYRGNGNVHLKTSVFPAKIIV